MEIWISAFISLCRYEMKSKSQGQAEWRGHTFPLLLLWTFLCLFDFKEARHNTGRKKKQIYNITDSAIGIYANIIIHREMDIDRILQPVSEDRQTRMFSLSTYNKITFSWFIHSHKMQCKKLFIEFFCLFQRSSFPDVPLSEIKSQGLSLNKMFQR